MSPSPRACPRALGPSRVSLKGPHDRGAPPIIRPRDITPGPSREQKPEWLKVRAPGSPNYLRLKGLMRDLKLNTVCEEARCPNIGECWHHGTATFMILGDVCTRACGYCAVPHGKPAELDPAEPARVAERSTRSALQLRRHHVGRSRRPGGRRRVESSPRRSAARARPPDCRIEVLIPDFQGERGATAGRARCGPGRPEPQHRDRAAAVSAGASGRPLPANAGAARSRAHVRAGHPDEDRPHGRPRRGVGRDRRDASRPAQAWAVRS